MPNKSRSTEVGRDHGSNKAGEAQRQRIASEGAALEEIARQQGLAYSMPGEDTAVRLLSNGMPFITGQSWSSRSVPGGAAFYTARITNPATQDYNLVFVTVFFGLANFFDDIAPGWVGRRQEWPQLSSGPLWLRAGETTPAEFRFTVPMGIAPTTYFGNAVVWRGAYHDKGTLFDRALFPITVA